MHQSLLNSVKATMVLKPDDYGAAATASAGVDMRGWDGVVFIAMAGTTLTTSLAVKAQQDDAVGFGTVADIAGAALTTIVAADKCAALDIKLGTYTKRYVRVLATTVGANNDVAILALQYRREGGVPITQVIDELKLV